MFRGQAVARKVCTILFIVFALSPQVASGRVKPPSGKAHRPPNVVIFLADDLGEGDVRPFYPGDFGTPTIERLARHGITFPNAYVTSGVCSPSRAAIMTGRYQARTGHDFNYAERLGGKVSLPLTERTVAQRLKLEGYSTALFGKWHLGIAAGYRPDERGFDRTLVFGESNVFIRHPAPGDLLVGVPTLPGREIPRTWNLKLNDQPVDENDYLTDIITRYSVQFIDHSDPKTPFFLVVSHHAPHVPIEATRRYVERVKSIPDEAHRTYAAMVVSLDDSLAAIEAALERKGVADNTILIFLSDNGCPEYDGPACSNAGLAGFKRDLREGGVRTPMIIRWPALHRAGTTYSQPVISVDLAATILSAAGWTNDGGPPLDGVDLKPFLTGKNTSAPHRHLYWRAGENHAIREGRWKLLSMMSPSGGSAVFLYDLASDPKETTNLAASNPGVARRLERDYAKWNASNPPPQAPPRTIDTDYHGVPVRLAF